MSHVLGQSSALICHKRSSKFVHKKIVVNMTNTLKYFELLDNLELDIDYGTIHHDDKKNPQNLSTIQRVSQNVDIIKKFIKKDVNIIFRMTSDELNLPRDKLKMEIRADDTDIVTDYVVYMIHVLHTLASKVNFDSDAREDLISTRHKNLYILAVQNTAIHAMRRNLHSDFYKSIIYKFYDSGCRGTSTLLCLSIECFAKLLGIKQLHVANSMVLVVRDFMAGIYTLKFMFHTKELIIPQVEHLLQGKLNFVWTYLTKLEYFRNLMLFKATPHFSVILQKMIHQDLLERLICKDGFSTFVATMETSQSADKQYLTYEVIAKVAAYPSYSIRYQQKMIQQVFEFCQTCVRNERMIDSIGAGLLTIRQLYDLNDSNIKFIINLIETHLKEFIQPADLLTGLIIMDHTEISARINLLYQLFCTSIVACLPSGLIVNYLPLLMHLYDSLPETNSECHQLRDLIIRCLDNRDAKNELPNIIESIYTRSYNTCWKSLHPRLLIVSDETSSGLILKVAPSDYEPEMNYSLILPNLLVNGNHHLLTYKIFMILLRLMGQHLTEPSSEMSSVELISSDSELIDFLNNKYPIKVAILLSLNELISHKPLKVQLSENTEEFMNLLQEILKQRLKLSQKCTDRTESADQTLLILLTLLQELIEQTKMIEACHSLLTLLSKIRAQTPNQLVQQRLDILESLINGGNASKASYSTISFQTARSLIESEESHLQVYGIQMILKLIHNKDSSTMTQGHLIVALALSTLRSKESYTFLNCVRLFVALLEVMETEVLEVLEGEYLSETVEVDVRLVVGEAILKVAKELGPCCYKYKATLLNCFMHGVRSPIDEFRMSSYSNLSQICSILNYQVDNFFQELLHLIDVELTSGKYLPAKRAAVYVLSELLESMENLVEFGDKLLPIYRILRAIEVSENCDPKMRQHATNGLKTLSEKCKQLIFQEQKLEKKIKILGVKGKPNRKLGQHILEIN